MQEGTVTASQHEPVTGFLERLFAPDALAGLVLVIGLILALGLVSAHYLRQQRDFEHKDEMLWGAHWFWAVVMAAETVLVVGTYLALTRTAYPLTSGFTAVFLGPVLLGVFLQRFHYQFLGAFFALQVWSSRMKDKAFDLQEWLEDQRTPDRKQRIIRLIAVVVQVVMVCGYVSLILAFAYPADRWRMKAMQAERLETVLQQRLASEQITSVECFAPAGRFLKSLSGRWWEQALHSVQDILGLAPESQPPRTREEYWHLFVKTKHGTTPQQARELADRAEDVIEHLDIGDYWHIVVYVKGRREPVRRYYPKKTHTEPPEGDLSGPTTLDSGGQKQ